MTLKQGCGSGSCSSSNWCESATTGLQTMQGFIFEPPSLHCEHPRLSKAPFWASKSSWILTSVRIRIQLLPLMRIRIQIQKLMRIRIRNPDLRITWLSKNYLTSHHKNYTALIRITDLTQMRNYLVLLWRPCRHLLTYPWSQGSSGWDSRHTR
jgi:hypothetical protein